MAGTSFNDICTMYAVCFDLLYDDGFCLSGMDQPYESWPLVRVKIVFGRTESVWLAFQLLVSLTTLTFIILSNLDKLKQSGRGGCQ
uniref:Uncharacterized protein n=1 Tax=Torque teno Leptonychotes weddellii virus-1 TaxID=2012676 RepID=A0A1Z2RV77_9VIRU|nr:hypothetical protein [Torque teno Leptonychotes weddellii virus 1]ASA48972.1 hypothetical protein [Torque teno Leptonychotes weddellii virus 1]ASA49024.1 hypothetical protein [Torque teno Leptonychotes weddellii virus 1]WCS65574.1 hypothetical protein [Torque teno Leptonychotes weddellii virus 1]WCS65862.1 hypothetical protein [Torque teno Leptonychotes weddellii virus 1]